MIRLEQLNALPPAAFAVTLGGIFEHSPWVAQRAAAARPFGSRLQLLDAMRAVVDAAAPAEQLALILAHPRLGVPGRSADPLTPASAGEQRRAGLGACTDAQAARLQALNALYMERFGFPFIIAVRGHDPASIIANLERRLDGDSDVERRTALDQIGTIAAYRLADTIASSPGPEIVAMLERLAQVFEPAAAASVAATALVRQWMQAAGLEVREATGGYLIGHTGHGEAGARTVLAGVCREPLAGVVRYQGRAAFVVAIEVAQQLRQQGTRAPFNLAVLARPEDGGADAADAADAEGDGIVRALRMAGMPATAVTLECQGNAAAGHTAISSLNVVAAGQAARALEQVMATRFAGDA